MRIIRIIIFGKQYATDVMRIFQITMTRTNTAFDQPHLTIKITMLIKLSIAVLLTVQLASNAFAAESVNIYSYRQPYLVEPIFEEFTKQTGIEVNTVFAKKGLVERLKNEGKNSPADLLITSNFSNLQAAVAADIAQPVSSETLNSNIPEQFRAPDGLWFGLTNRARLIVVSKDRMAEARPADYEDLADPAYKGKICTRSAKHSYMVALTASVIAHAGNDTARGWLSGMKANLARKPQGNDRAQVKAISQGECDIAIINSYYMGAMLADEEQTAWANSVDLIFPNQDNRGTHMNISGMALTKAAPNKANAIKLMEFLSADNAQQYYADVNHEYPVNQNVQPSELVRSWGEFKYDTLPLAEIAKFRNDATRMADEVNYDN